MPPILNGIYQSSAGYLVRVLSNNARVYPERKTLKSTYTHMYTGVVYEYVACPRQSVSLRVGLVVVKDVDEFNESFELWNGELDEY